MAVLAVGHPSQCGQTEFVAGMETIYGIRGMWLERFNIGIRDCQTRNSGGIGFALEVDGCTRH